MGIFSTKKKLVAFTAVQRMIEDNNIIDSSKIATLRYLLENDGRTSVGLNSKTIPDYIIEATSNTLQAKYKAAYLYAAASHYAYGIPTANNVTTHGVDIAPPIKDYIESTIGHTVSMLYAFIGDANYQHFLWKKLIDSYGYNPSTNELTTLSSSVGFPCYLQTGTLYFGMATIGSDETGEALKQYGLSIENGECLTRPQDIGRSSIPASVDTDVQDAYATITYQYIEVIPDTTAPPDAVVNTLSTTSIEGYAEKNSSVSISVNTVFVDSVVADADGYFSYTFSPAIVATDVVTLVVTDSASNSSTGVDTVVPYTNSTPASIGTDETITEVTHTVSTTFDFLDYIPSAVPYLPAEPEDTPITVPGDDSYVPEFDYIQASYTYEDMGNTYVGYLTYAYGTNTIPDLENLFTTSSASGEFYPRLYSRLNGVDLPNTLSHSSPEFKSSVYLAKLLGLNWKDWSQTLHDSIEDIADVSNMFTTLAVPLNTTDAYINEYLFRYWLKTYDELPTYLSSGVLVPLNGKEGNTLEIADNVYSHFISFKAVTHRTITGSIGAVGTYASEYVNEYESAVFDGYSDGTGILEYSSEYSIDYPSCHIYKWQNTETTYVEVRVYEAKSVHMFAGSSTTAVGTDEALLIPLDRTAVTYMSNKEKEYLYAKCLYLFVNMAKIIKIKWYQRSTFKIVINVLAIVIIVMTKGAGTKLALALLKLLIINVVINLIIRIMIKLGVREDVANAIGSVIGFLLGGDISSFTSTISASAVQALQALSVAFNIYSKTYQYRMKALAQEAEDFYQSSKEKEQELKRAQLLLDTDVVDMDLQLLLRDQRSSVFIRLGESPTDFLLRNPIYTQEMLLSLVENYSDLTKRQPSLQAILNKAKRGDDYAYDV